MNSKKLCWLDIRASGAMKSAVITEAIHHRIDGIATDDPADLVGLPPTIRKILLVAGEQLPEGAEAADVVILPTGFTDRAEVAAAYPHAEFGSYVEIVDAASLELACESARSELWSLLNFRDPTKSRWRSSSRPLPAPRAPSSSRSPMPKRQRSSSASSSSGPKV